MNDTKDKMEVMRLNSSLMDSLNYFVIYYEI